MSIIKKYETQQDKNEEIRLGAFFQKYYMPEIETVNLGFLSPFDFALKRDGKVFGFLEVKKKTMHFSKYEIIPQNKWDFLEKTTLVCYALIEREGVGRLFNLSDILGSGRYWKKEIKRREDQPGGSKRVVAFFSDRGKDIYYLS